MSKSSKSNLPNSSNRRGQTTLPAKSGRRKPGLSGFYNQGSAKTTDKYCPTRETRVGLIGEGLAQGTLRRSVQPMPHRPDVDKAGSQESHYTPKSPQHKGDKARGFESTDKKISRKDLHTSFPSSLSNPRQVSSGSSGASIGAKRSQAEDLSFIEIFKILRGF